MITKRITRVTLTRTTEPTPGDHTHHPGDELWRVEWTRTFSSGKTETLRATSDTELLARRLIGNLLRQIPDGVAIEDVYSEEL